MTLSKYEEDLKNEENLKSDYDLRNKDNKLWLKLCQANVKVQFGFS